MDVRVGPSKRLSIKGLMFLKFGAGEDSWESLGLQGDQSWVFTGRTDAEAETPVLGPPDVKIWLIWEDPDAGKDWRWEEKGATEDEMVGWHHRLNGHEFEWTLGVCDGQGGPGMLQSMGSQRVKHEWVIKPNRTELCHSFKCCALLFSLLLQKHFLLLMKI